MSTFEGIGRPCPECNGQGGFPSADEAAATGKRRTKCEHCDGTGTDPKYAMERELTETIQVMQEVNDLAVEEVVWLVTTAMTNVIKNMLQLQKEDRSDGEE